MKKLFIIFLSVVCLCALSVWCAAYTVTPYGDVTGSSSIANNLVDLYRNGTDYDPLQEFAVIRESQYVYTLFYGEKLSRSFNFIRYTQAHNTVPQSYSFGSGSNLQINDNGYLFTGNISGAAASERADGYMFRFLIILAFTFLLIIVIFKVFHRRVNMSPVKGYTIR